MKTNPETILEKYCELANWQGGTIHQAFVDFLERDMPFKDALCSWIAANVRNLSNADMSIAKEFMAARNNYLQVKTLSNGL